MTSGIILNTRPAVYRARFHQAFGGLGWPIVDCPVLITEQLSAFMPPPSNFDILIFTSQIAVALFPASAWLKKKVLAVGSGTAEAARAAGFADIHQTGEDADDLRRYIAGAKFKSALYPSAEDVTSDLSKEFPGRVQRIVTYRMKPAGSLPAAVTSAAAKKTVIVAPLFSRRSAVVLADLLAKAGITAAAAIGISADIFAPEGGPWQRRAVAAAPTLEGVAAMTREVVNELAGQGSVVQ